MADKEISLPLVGVSVLIGGLLFFLLASSFFSSSSEEKKTVKSKVKSVQSKKQKKTKKAQQEGNKGKTKGTSSSGIKQPIKPKQTQEEEKSQTTNNSPRKSKSKKKSKKPTNVDTPPDELPNNDIALQNSVAQTSNLDDSEEGWEMVRPNRRKSTKAMKLSEDAGVKKEQSNQSEQAIVDIGDKASILIGEKGSTINKIQMFSGAKLNTNRANQTCTIVGTAEQVETAKKMVQELLENQKFENFPLKNRLQETIIRNPEHIKKIQVESGARIQVNSDGSDTICKLTGSSEQIQTAKEVITSLLNENANTDTKHTIVLDAHMGKQLIGRKGATVSSIEQASGARIHVDIRDPQAIVTIVGSKEHKEKGVDAVEKFVKERSFTVSVPIDNQAVAMVLGNLNSLRTSSNVGIDVSSDRTSIKLTGTAQEVEDAKTKIINWIDSELGPPKISPGQHLETIELGSAVGKVIGKGGSTIDELARSAEGVQIKVKQTTCYVYGDHEGVLKVKKEIDSIIEKHIEVIASAEKEEKLLSGATWALPSESALEKVAATAKWDGDFPSDTTSKESQDFIVSDWGGALAAEGW